MLHQREIEAELREGAREFRLFQELQSAQRSPFRGRTISETMTREELETLIPACLNIDDLAREIL